MIDAARVVDWLRDLWLSRRRLRVRTRLGYLPTVVPEHLLVIVEAVNAGHRRVVVNGCGLDVNRNEHAIVPAGSSPHLPTPLEEGDQVVAWVLADVLAGNLKGFGYQGVVKLRAWVGDTTGRTHRGNTIEVGLGTQD